MENHHFRVLKSTPWPRQTSVSSPSPGRPGRTTQQRGWRTGWGPSSSTARCSTRCDGGDGVMGLGGWIPGTNVSYFQKNKKQMYIYIYTLHMLLHFIYFIDIDKYLFTYMYEPGPRTPIPPSPNLTFVRSLQYCRATTWSLDPIAYLRHDFLLVVHRPLWAPQKKTGNTDTFHNVPVCDSLQSAAIYYKHISIDR